MSYAAEAFSRLRELTTGPDYIKRCLQIDIKKLLEGRPRPPKGSNADPRVMYRTLSL